MISEDNLATAQLAQLFGSELLKVQNSARTDSGSIPHIVNLDPKQFLVNQQGVQQRRKLEEQRMIQALQREAEAACPLPPSTYIPPQPETITQATFNPPPSNPINISTTTISPIGGNSSSDPLARIAQSLERIANRLDGVDLQIKKKRISKRTK